jgi:hypothetical protein
MKTRWLLAHPYSGLQSFTKPMSVLNQAMRLCSLLLMSFRPAPVSARLLCSKGADAHNAIVIEERNTIWVASGASLSRRYPKEW